MFWSFSSPFSSTFFNLLTFSDFLIIYVIPKVKSWKNKILSHYLLKPGGTKWLSYASYLLDIFLDKKMKYMGMLIITNQDKQKA